MSDLAIRVKDLSKRYTIVTAGARHDTLREHLAYSLRNLVPGNGHLKSGTDTVWALKDVSFEVKQGEVIGIIGSNGAGKSTLLKILSRIMSPTSGRVEMCGRVGSLLEVGTGFDRELTGRENIYLSGAILGMKKAEIDHKFDEIVDFSGVVKFIDTPIKHYSSGMYVRLAFAVAAHLEPEILIVDEVLAVGDAVFQKKCLGKMENVAKEGRTVLFVSHNMAVISNLCPKVMLLAQGSIEHLGTAEESVRQYVGTAVSPGDGQVNLTGHPARRPGSLPLLKAVKLLDSRGKVRDRFQSGEPITVELEFDPIMRLDEPQFAIGVDDGFGTRIFSVATYLSSSRLRPLLEPCKVTCLIDELALEPGRYTLSLSAGTPQNTLLEALDQPIAFDVEASDFYGNGRVPTGLGRVLVRSRWAVL